jgi:flagellar biosynthetic protein FlhB
MAEEFAESRNESPTQRRREEAREQGQIAFSGELSGSLLLLAALAMIFVNGNNLGSGLIDVVNQDFNQARYKVFDQGRAATLLTDLAIHGGQLFGYFFGLVVFIAFVSNVLQVGFHIVPGLLSLKPERLSPAEGFGRLFSLPAFVRGLGSVIKVAVLAGIVYFMLGGKGSEIASLGEGHLASAVSQSWNLIMRVALAIAVAFLIVGIVDYVYQRFRFEKALLMSRQELKDELKRDEGDPLIKARIRRMQREAAKKRMFRELPKASVVITNPTHLAVALRYEQGKQAAPRVVAKGAGFVAKEIVEVAKRYAIPVIERKPLAQALYKAIEVDQEIPAALYQAVAELLAYLYKLRGLV